jgi:hypothetical protein
MVLKELFSGIQWSLTIHGTLMERVNRELWKKPVERLFICKKWFLNQIDNLS